MFTLFYFVLFILFCVLLTYLRYFNIRRMHIVYSQNEYMNAKIEMNGKQGVLKLEK